MHFSRYDDGAARFMLRPTAPRHATTTTVCFRPVVRAQCFQTYQQAQAARDEEDLKEQLAHTRQLVLHRSKPPIPAPRCRHRYRDVLVLHRSKPAMDSFHWFRGIPYRRPAD